MANTKGRHSSDEQPNDVMTATGIVSHRTGEPLVEMRWGPQRGQLTPHDVAGHCQMLLREAWWADSDAALVKFLRVGLQLDEDRAARVMHDFRLFRLKQLDDAAAAELQRQRDAYERWARDELDRRKREGRE